MDGWWVTVWYPESAGEFQGGPSPPTGLLDVAVASYGCSVCMCHETWTTREPSDDDSEETELIETNAVDFCVRLLEEEAQCSGCLATWDGGAG